MAGTFRQDEDGNLYRMPEERIEHSPVTDLFLDGRHVGARCLHCGMLLTVSRKPSQEKFLRNPKHDKPGVVRVVDNKAHSRRATAATETLWGRMKDMMKGIRGE